MLARTSNDMGPCGLVASHCRSHERLTASSRSRARASLSRIPRIVIGENRTFQGPEDYVRSQGVVLEIVDDSECIELMRQFMAQLDAWSLGGEFEDFHFTAVMPEGVKEVDFGMAAADGEVD